MRAVFAPNGTSLITRAGRVVELGDGLRTLVDADGDGHFDPQTGVLRRALRLRRRRRLRQPRPHLPVRARAVPTATTAGSAPACRAATFTRPDCGPDGLCKALPYQCGDGRTLRQPGRPVHLRRRRCLGCDDCAAPPASRRASRASRSTSSRIDVYGAGAAGGRPGGDAPARSATLSDGTVDRRHLARHLGVVGAGGGDGRHLGPPRAPLAVGATDITAALGAVRQRAAGASTVVERPTLQRIYRAEHQLLLLRARRSRAAARRATAADAVRRLPAAAVLPAGGARRRDASSSSPSASSTPATTRTSPTRSSGGSIRPAVGDVVERACSPPRRPARRAADRRARPASRATPLTIKVVTEATIVSLSIYPGNYAYQYVDGGPVRPESTPPCFECGYSVTVLRGDTLQLLGHRALRHRRVGGRHRPRHLAQQRRRRRDDRRRPA